MGEPTIKVSDNAVSSVTAVLSGRDFSAEKKAFYELVAKCVLKPGGHVEAPAQTGMNRLYVITTWAPTPAYGGQRTVSVCDSFERARKIVEENVGDIYECSYKLVAIEMLPANYLYWSGPNETYWYMWVHEPHAEDTYDGTYRAIEIPPGMEDKTLHPIG